MSPRFYTRLMTLAVSLAAACGAPLSPSDVAGIYTLQRVANESLPTLLFTSGIRVVADTLRFESGGRGTRITVVEGEPYQGFPARQESSFQFRISDGRIELGFICPPNGNCVAAPHMTFRRADSGLRADFALGERTPLMYARIDSSR